jgi:hypothetical protein
VFRGVSSEFLSTFLLLRIAQNSRESIAIRPTAPTTPPTTAAAVGFVLEEIPELVWGWAWSEVEAGGEFKEVFEGAWKALSLPLPDIIVGVACSSLCAMTITILDEVVGVVPFDAGNAGALTTDACVVEDVLKTAAEAVVAPVAVALATGEAAAKLTEETPPSPASPPPVPPTPAFAPPPAVPATFG